MYKSTRWSQQYLSFFLKLFVDNNYITLRNNHNVLTINSSIQLKVFKTVLFPPGKGSKLLNNVDLKVINNRCLVQHTSLDLQQKGKFDYYDCFNLSKYAVCGSILATR